MNSRCLVPSPPRCRINLSFLAVEWALGAHPSTIVNIIVLIKVPLKTARIKARKRRVAAKRLTNTCLASQNEKLALTPDSLYSRFVIINSERRPDLVHVARGG